MGSLGDLVKLHAVDGSQQPPNVPRPAQRLAANLGHENPIPKVSSSKFSDGVPGVERSEPPVWHDSVGSLRSTPATLAWQVLNLELLTA